MVLDDYAALWPQWYGVGRDSDKCGTSVTGWMSRFLEEIENSFVAEGFLEKHGTLKRWSVSFMDEFEAQSTGFVLRRVDLVGWLNVSAGDGICDAIVLFDNFFNTTFATRYSWQDSVPPFAGSAASTVCETPGRACPNSFRHRSPCCPLVFSQCSS